MYLRNQRETIGSIVPQIKTITAGENLGLDFLKQPLVLSLIAAEARSAVRTYSGKQGYRSLRRTEHPLSHKKLYAYKVVTLSSFQHL